MADIDQDKRIEEDEERKFNDKIWEAFMAYDHEQFGYISVNDLRAALEKAGESVSEDMAYLMISVADPENTSKI